MKKKTNNNNNNNGGQFATEINYRIFANSPLVVAFILDKSPVAVQQLYLMITT